MSKPEILEKSPMNVVQVNDALERIKASEEGLELNFRAAKTEEYAQDFSKLKLKDANALVEKLTALDVPRLKDVHIHKLVDLLPQSEKMVKIVLSGYHLTVSQENIKQIVDVLGEYADKRK